MATKKILGRRRELNGKEIRFAEDVDMYVPPVGRSGRVRVWTGRPASFRARLRIAVERFFTLNPGEGVTDQEFRDVEFWAE